MRSLPTPQTPTGATHDVALNSLVVPPVDLSSFAPYHAEWREGAALRLADGRPSFSTDTPYPQHAAKARAWRAGWLWANRQCNYLDAFVLRQGDPDPDHRVPNDRDRAPGVGEEVAP